MIETVVTFLGSIALLIVLIGIGWTIYERTSDFHIKVNRIPGPEFNLPFLLKGISGGFDCKIIECVFVSYATHDRIHILCAN